MDQLVASWEDSAHEDGLPGGKMCRISNTISLLSLIFPCTVDVAPDVGFRLSWCLWKAYDVFFRVSQSCKESGLGPWATTLQTKALEVFFHDEESFSDQDSGLTGEAFGNLRVAHHSWTYPFP